MPSGGNTKDQEDRDKKDQEVAMVEDKMLKISDSQLKMKQTSSFNINQ